MLKERILAVALSVLVSAAMILPGAEIVSAAGKYDKNSKAALKEETLKKGFEVKEITKDGSRLAIKGFDKYSSDADIKDYARAVDNVSVNGTEYKLDYSDDDGWDISTLKNWLSVGPAAFAEGENKVVIKAKGYEDKTVKFKKEGDDFTFISQSDGSDVGPTPPNPPNPGNPVEDPKEDGEYTLSFKVTKTGTEEPLPMVGNALDKRAKLVVNKGKLKLTLLNNKLASQMVDMSVGIDDTFSPAEKKGFDKPNASGEYDAYEYTMPVEHIEKKHVIAVLVKAMGGKEEDKHKWELYRKADISFKSIKKGWTGYESSITAEEALTKALVARGYDTNNDKEISDDEIRAISGELELENCRLTDISRLRLLSDKVTKLTISNNKIEEVPADLLSNLTKLEFFIADGNLLSEIPEGFFKNNKELKWISMEANRIKDVKRTDFQGLNKVYNFDLGKNKISRVDEDFLADMTELKQLSLAGNNLKSVPDNLLKPVKNTLTFIDLKNNKLTKMPKTIGQATKLTNIQLYMNQITDISGVDFSKLKELKTLQLMKNSIGSLPKKVFAKNDKLESVDLHDNQLKSVSADVLPKGAYMHKFDLSLNNIVAIDPALAKKMKSWNKLYPQKSSIALKLSEDKKGNLKFTQKFDMLNLRFWYDKTVSDYEMELTTIAEYKEMLKAKNLDKKDITEILKEGGQNWNIITKLQKKKSDGSFETISEEKSSDVADKMSDVYEKNGKGTYRIVKVLNMTINGTMTRAMQLESNQYTVGNASDDKDFAKKIMVKNLKAKNISKKKVLLKWNKVKKAKFYYVYRAVKKNGKHKKNIKFKKIKVVKGSEGKFIDKKVKKGQVYIYKVRACVKKGSKLVYGKFSSAKTVKVKK